MAVMGKPPQPTLLVPAGLSYPLRDFSHALRTLLGLVECLEGTGGEAQGVAAGSVKDS